MDIGDIIRERRSIRKYKDKTVKEDDLTEIMECALYAPSAGDLQSRHFYVVKDQKKRERLSSAALDQKFIAQAPAVVVVCADHRIEKEYGETGKSLYSVLDCAASIQNMLLRAYSLGIGSCWVGAFDEKKVGKILNIPSHLRPVSIITLGYPAESPKATKRKANSIEMV
jgi:nitroreductase